MSMYADYVRELLGDWVLETDKGFATYRFTDPKTVYILNIYVHPDFRKHRVASDIADKIMELARKRGCNRMLGSVTPSAKGSTESLRVLLGYGMTLDSSANDFILFRKDIKQ